MGLTSVVDTDDKSMASSLARVMISTGAYAFTTDDTKNWPRTFQVFPIDQVMVHSYQQFEQFF